MLWLSVSELINLIVSKLTPDNVLPVDPDIPVTVMSGLHVEETDDVEPLMDDYDRVEAAAAGNVTCYVEDVYTTLGPVAHVGVATVGVTLKGS